LQKVLYQPLKEKPRIDPADAAFIKDALDSEMAAVETRFGVDLRRRWGWESR